MKRYLLYCLLPLAGSLNAQNAEDIKAITKDYPLEKLEAMALEFEEEYKNRHAQALEYAQANNIPITFETKDGATAELQYLDEDGQPVYYRTDNGDAADYTNTENLHKGGSLGLDLEGQGMRAFVWERGPGRTSHKYFSNRLTAKDNNAHTSHATHVTGTIIGRKGLKLFGFVSIPSGMAPKANADIYNWDSDRSEATRAAANDGMLLSNHSYGPVIFRDDGTQVKDADDFGRYDFEAMAWDRILYNADYYLMVKSAGNNGEENSANSTPLGGQRNRDKLLGEALSKNNLVVANGKSSGINSGSSQGPADDLRVKPDITGYGTNVFSSDNDNDDDYVRKTGTSMATPNVMGSLLLLQQHYKNKNGQFARAATIKGLALHTAVDKGKDGPDPLYGWGRFDAKIAANVITNNGNTALIEETELQNGQSYQVIVKNGSGSFETSISWTDPPGSTKYGINNSSPALVNDLDVRVIELNNTRKEHKPWRLTSVNGNGKGDNKVDPFEKVEIGSSNTSKYYAIVVTHKGSLHSGRQKFSLIVTGAAEVLANKEIDPKYIEGFNGNFGDWIQPSDLGDHFNWTINSGTTPSGGTGPSSAAGGSHYMYAESSSPNYPIKSAWIISPVFDLRNTSTPSLRFKYHMRGSDIGHLIIHASVNGGENWKKIFTISGHQGDNWKTANVSLNQFKGKCVFFRFMVSTAGGYKGDIAVDRVELFDGAIDLTPPTIPGRADPTHITRTSAQLNWLASTDNVGVDHYEILGPNNFFETTANTQLALTNLPTDVIQLYRIRAVDVNGNASGFLAVFVTAKAPEDHIGHYPLDQSLDNLGSSGINAVAKRTGSYTSGNFNGGSGYSFGGNNYLTLNTTGNSGYLHDAFTERTVAFWMYPTTARSGYYQTLFKEGNSTNGIELMLSANSGLLAFQLYIKGSGVVDIYSHGIAVPRNEWTHVAVTYNANGQIRYYVNGKKVWYNTTPAPKILLHTDGAYLGGTPGTGHYQGWAPNRNNYYKGTMDEVHIFSRELDADEICTLASACRQSNGEATSIGETIVYGVTTKEVQVFPNPAKNHVNVTSSAPLRRIVGYHYSGQVVLEQWFEETERSAQLNTAEWRSGIYILEILTHGGNVSKTKVVIE